MVNNRLADTLTRIRNAIILKDRTLTVPSTKLNFALLTILTNEGYIRFFRIIDKEYVVFLKYKEGESVIRSLKLISKASARKYISAKDIKFHSHKISILSTSKGLLSNTDAYKYKIGGELLCEIK